MSNYRLYGDKLISDDRTLTNFAHCIINLVPTDDIAELENNYNEGFEEDREFEDEFMKRVGEILEHDISRTDIDYPALMEKYSAEIGPLLYDIENHGGSLETVGLTFFGEGAAMAFNRLVTEKVWFLKFYGGGVND